MRKNNLFARKVVNKNKSKTLCGIKMRLKDKKSSKLKHCILRSWTTKEKANMHHLLTNMIT